MCRMQIYSTVFPFHECTNMLGRILWFRELTQQIAVPHNDVSVCIHAWEVCSLDTNFPELGKNSHIAIPPVIEVVRRIAGLTPRPKRHPRLHLFSPSFELNACSLSSACCKETIEMKLGGQFTRFIIGFVL
jgi:hypothetical protein